jgi:magnesium-protoporphyrin IX monomethyl ester (oxidative) cyclase
MERLFSLEINPNLPADELEACAAEFRNDYNQRHFVRNETFKGAADGITGETRRIFIEFLERSCTAEFSGFLLYKELGRRLKATAPVVAEIFTLMSRDEVRCGVERWWRCCFVRLFFCFSLPAFLRLCTAAHPRHTRTPPS